MTNDPKKQFRIINLAKEVAPPTIEPSKGKDDTYMNWGKYNMFPNEMLELYLTKSTLFRKIIDRRVRLTTGNGFKLKDISSKLYDFLTRVCGGDKTLEKINFDYEIAELYGLEIIWNEAGDDLDSVRYIPFQNIREDIINVKELDENNNKVYKHYWVAPDWSRNCKIKPTAKNNRFIEYNEIKNTGENRTQILYVKKFTSGIPYYSAPAWYLYSNWLTCDYEVGKFQATGVEFGFHVGYILNFADDIPEELFYELCEEFEREMYGSHNNKKVFITKSNGKERRPTIEAIPSSATDGFIENLIKQTRQKIFEMTDVLMPEFFAQSTAGQLGNKQQLIDGLVIWKAMDFSTNQYLFEKTFMDLAKGASIDDYEKIYIDSFQLEPEPVLTDAEILASKLSLLEPNIANKVMDNMSETELRSLVGLIGPKPSDEPTDNEFENKNNLN